MTEFVIWQWVIILMINKLLTLAMVIIQINSETCYSLMIIWIHMLHIYTYILTDLETTSRYFLMKDGFRQTVLIYHKIYSTYDDHGHCTKQYRELSCRCLQQLNHRLSRRKGCQGKNARRYVIFHNNDRNCK